MTTGPYRDSPRKALPPARLEVWLRDGDRYAWLRGAYVRAAFTLLGFVFLRQLMTADWGGYLVLLLGAIWVFGAFRSRHGARVVVEVAGGRIVIRRPQNAQLLELDFEQLQDVRLDTKTQTRNLAIARADGVNTVFGSIVSGGGRQLDVDVSRIEVCVEGVDAPLLLARDFVSQSQCAESLRSIRLFLRGHGWKPLDERKAEDE